MIDPGPRGTAHKPQLDGLRFLAFLAVFFFHAKPGRYFWGPQGVQVFFTLSGFLITRILIRDESGSLREDLRRFMIRRTLRIFPLYYAVVLGLWATGGLAGLGWYLGYIYNIRAFLIHDWGGPVGHFWTLCVEEQFYLLYPITFWLTPARHRLALIAGLILASKVFQTYAQTRLSLPWSTFLLPYCGEHLLWGCLAGLIEAKTRTRRGEGTIAVLLGLALMLATRARPGWHVEPPPTWWVLVAFSGFGVGSSLVVFGLWRTSNPLLVFPLSLRPVVYLGRISYGLYVYHLLAIERRWVGYLPESYLFPEPYGELLVTILVASASWYLLERPINRLKDRWTGRGRQGFPAIEETRGSSG